MDHDKVELEKWFKFQNRTIIKIIEVARPDFSNDQDFRFDKMFKCTDWIVRSDHNNSKDKESFNNSPYKNGTPQPLTHDDNHNPVLTSWFQTNNRPLDLDLILLCHIETVPVFFSSCFWMKITCEESVAFFWKNREQFKVPSLELLSRPRVVFLGLGISLSVYRNNLRQFGNATRSDNTDTVFPSTYSCSFQACNN